MPFRRSIFSPISLTCIAIASRLAFRAGQYIGTSLYGSGPSTTKGGHRFQSSSTKSYSKIKGYDSMSHGYGSCDIQMCANHSNTKTSPLDNSDVFHEALVHPVMFMHNNPIRVAIMGDGREKTIGNVLKHKSVNMLKLFSFDPLLDIEELLNFNNTKLDIAYASWDHWLHLRSSESLEGYTSKEKFDVIILDNVFQTQILSSNEQVKNFTRNLHESLTNDGVIVFYLGDSYKYNDPIGELRDKFYVQPLMRHLSEANFEDMFMYEESHCGSSRPCLFLLALKNTKSKSLWYRNEAQIQNEIHQRIIKSHGEPYFNYFDGSIFNSYQIPHKVIETMYCRSSPIPKACIKRPKITDVPLSNLHVGLSTIGDGSGRGVFTDIDIKKGHTIARKTFTLTVELPPHSHEIMLNYLEFSDDHEILFNYMDGYGWESTLHGETSYFVDSSILSFVNHGCNGNFNVDDTSRILDKESSDKNESFDPVFLRRQDSTLTAVRDIEAGDELFCDYTYFSTGEDFLPALDELNRMCNGDKSIGLITQTERRRSET